MNHERVQHDKRSSTLNEKRIIRVAQLTLTAVLALLFTGHAQAKNHHASDKIIIVSPADLPEQARVTGLDMMLHDTLDGRTLLYIEQNQGARLAIFDVTDPSHVKVEGSARVDAPDSFDIVSSLGADAVLVRFRNGQGDAVLSLHKVKTPTLNMIQGLYSRGAMEFLGDDVLLVAKRPSVQFDANDTNYQVVDISNPLHPDTLPDINQVFEKITNDETGTTFLLAADGLYLIRRPAVEEEFKIRQQQMRHTP